MPEDNFQLNTPALPGTVMPFSAEAEQAVLGAVLLEPDCLSTVAEMLPRADYFYQVNNRTIYSAMLDMFTAGQPVDLVTLLEHLREEENFDEGSGKVYLMQLAQLVPSVSNVERYCAIVRDRYDLRMLIQAARGILDDAMEDTGETSLLLDSAEQRIFDIRQGKALKGLERLNEVLFETFERLDRLNSPDKDLYRGIPTGIRELDNTITGRTAPTLSSSAHDRHGQNELCAEHCAPCRHHGGQARGVFLAGNEQGAARFPYHFHGGTRRRHKAAHGRLDGGRMDAPCGGGRYSL